MRILDLKNVTQRINTLFIILVIGILATLFYFRLGNLSLQSYDEAWYGSIARNIIRTGNIFELTFNESRFVDHPPFGYFLMSVGILTFGDNEFGVRFISASLGIFSIIVLYLIGISIANKWVGWGASAILLSCLWFMFRARSGNLDVPFIFFTLLSYYFLIQSQKNIKYFYASSVSFALLFLTKTLIGIGMIPVILFFIFILRKKLNFKFLIINLLLVLLIITPWYIYQIVSDPNFITHHFFTIGLRKDSNSFNLASLQENFNYLQIAVGKWYKIFFIGTMLSIYISYKNKSMRIPIISLLIFISSFGIPLFSSSQTQIWHLLPVIPPLCLLTSYTLHRIFDTVSSNFKKFAPVVTIALTVLSAYQYLEFQNLLYPIENYNSQKDISLAASNFDQVYLFDTFYPMAVYYSDTHVSDSNFSNNAGQLLHEFILSKPANSAAIINQVSYDDIARNDLNFSVIYKNDTYYLVR